MYWIQKLLPFRREARSPQWLSSGPCCWGAGERGLGRRQPLWKPPGGLGDLLLTRLLLPLKQGSIWRPPPPPPRCHYRDENNMGAVGMPWKAEGVWGRWRVERGPWCAESTSTVEIMVRPAGERGACAGAPCSTRREGKMEDRRRLRWRSEILLGRSRRRWFVEQWGQKVLVQTFPCLPEIEWVSRLIWEENL